VIAYKFTRRAGQALFSTFAWPLPTADGAGEWVEVEGPLEVCRHGLHACRIEDLAFWISAELFEVELAGEPLGYAAGLVAQRARLLRPVANWNPSCAQHFADACVERARARHARVVQPSAAAEAFLTEALRFAADGVHGAAAYAAALACVELAPEAPPDEVFNAERAQQGPLLAELLGL
jgi:hypothetical protein